MLVGNCNNEAGLGSAIAEQAGKKLPTSLVDLADLSFTCSAGKAAKTRIQKGVTTWRYRYFGDWPNSRLSNDSGAYHSSEVNLLFGTGELVTGIRDSENEIKLAKLMRVAWSSFAKDPESGLTVLGWPKYNDTGKTHSFETL
jgi:cholinesterase